MRTPASIFKHPIHPMLIVFPIGLWIFSLACDLIRLTGASGDAWSTVASLAPSARRYQDLSTCSSIRGCSAGQKNSSDPHGDQSHRRRAVCDKYLAARQRSHQYEQKREHSRSAFDYRRSASRCIRMAWRSNGACLWRRR